MKKVNQVIKNFFNKYPWQFWMIIIAAVIVQLILFRYKDLLHVDEMSTLGLAFGDKEVLLFHHPDDFDNHLFIGKDLFQLFMSEEGRYSRLWQNLPLDHHMPLYFLFLNIFGAEFYTHFTILPAIIVNVLTLLGLLCGFYLVTLQLFQKQNIACIGLLFFAFMTPVLSLEIFVRMYLLWMTLALWGTLYFIEFLQFKKNKALIGVFVFLLAQILTHYYGLIYAFSLSLAGGLILFLEKRYKQFGYFAGVMLGTVVVAVLIYPAMIKVGHDSEQGAEFWKNFELLFSNPREVIETKLPYFWNNVCGGGYALISELILIIGGVVLALKHKVIEHKDGQIVAFLVMTVLGFGFLAAWVQPDMGRYQVRYFAPIVPLAAIAGIYLFMIWGKLLHINANVLSLLLWLIAAGQGIYVGINNDNPFYFRNKRENVRFGRIVDGADIWWAMGGGWTHSYYIHNFADMVESVDKLWTLVDFDDKNFVAFSDEEINQKKYAYVLFPPQQAKAPEWVAQWVEKTTGRKAYYLFTIPYDLDNFSIAFPASVFLVTPY